MPASEPGDNMEPYPSNQARRLACSETSMQRCAMRREKHAYIMPVNHQEVVQR